MVKIWKLLMCSFQNIKVFEIRPKIDWDMAKFGQKFIEILIMPKFISAIVDHKKIVFIFKIFFSS